MSMLVALALLAWLCLAMSLTVLAAEPEEEGDRANAKAKT